MANQFSENECSIAACDRKVSARRLCSRHYARLRKYGDPNRTLLNVGDGSSFEQRFWSRVVKTDSCWMWTGCVSEDGYGQIKFRQKSMAAHRFVWYLEHGKMPEKFLLHSCDNRACVNLAHLREGTPQENSADMVRRNRQAKGLQHGMAKLSDGDADLIRELLDGGASGVSLAEIFGVSASTICEIKRNRIHRAQPIRNSDSAP